jgi:hypothetical protein
MDNDENKPDVIQIPLLHDPAFDPSEPVKRSGKRQRPSQSPSKKTDQYPPGYDPDTVDLFEDIIDPIEFANEDALDTDEADAVQETGNPTTRLDENLRAELSDELSIILKHLNDHPES